MRKSVISLLSTLILLVTGAAVLAAPATAAVRDGVCDSGEFCYYFNSDQVGAISDFTTSIADYGDTQPSCYEFKGSDPAHGEGKCTKNNAASVWNRTGKTVRVHYNSNYGNDKPPQDIAAGAKVNLNSDLKNQNASHEILAGGGGGTSCSSDGSDTRLPSYIFVYRESANTVVKVDFKTYVKNVLPNEWLPGWNAEALKAGAVAAKTFAWYYALHSASKTSDGRCFDVYDNTKSQVYTPGSAVTSTSNAVDATWGVRMTRDSKIFIAHYCATSTACRDWVDGQWMSQNGSQTLATQGKGYQAILKTYYTGIALSS